MQSPRKLSKTISVVITALASALLLQAPGLAADPDYVLETSRWVISGEGTVAHFGARLNDRAIQAWNLSARFSLLPFGVNHLRVLRGILDSDLESDSNQPSSASQYATCVEYSRIRQL